MGGDGSPYICERLYLSVSVFHFSRKPYPQCKKLPSIRKDKPLFVVSLLWRVLYVPYHADGAANRDAITIKSQKGRRLRFSVSKIRFPARAHEHDEYHEKYRLTLGGM